MRETKIFPAIILDSEDEGMKTRPSTADVDKAYIEVKNGDVDKKDKDGKDDEKEKKEKKEAEKMVGMFEVVSI